MTAAPAYMFDTNIFNDLLDDKFSLLIFGSHRLVATGIQRDEISKTKTDARRVELLKRFDIIDPCIERVASFAFDIEGAGFDQADWNDGTGSFECMLQCFHELGRGKKKRHRDPLNPVRDTLIAETAIKVQAVLVSGDCNLRAVMVEFGGQAVDPATLPECIFQSDERQVAMTIEPGAPGGTA